MEDKIKVLETKLKLSQDINRYNESLIYNLRELAKESLNILIWNRGGESTQDNNIYTLDKEKLDKLEDLIYTAKSEDLISERTAAYLKEYAREKQIKQEILNGL